MENKKRTVFLKVTPTDKEGVFDTELQRIERENISNEEIEKSKGNYSGNALDRNVKLMSPTRMVIRRFFKSKLSIVGLVMVLGLFIFSFIGPYVYHMLVPATDIKGSGYTSTVDENTTWLERFKTRGWQQDEKDSSGKLEYTVSEYKVTTNQTITITYGDSTTEKFTYKMDKSNNPILCDSNGNELDKSLYKITFDEKGSLLSITLNKKVYSLTKESETNVSNAITTEYKSGDISVSEYKYEYVVNQILETNKITNNLAPISAVHPLGTDNDGYDVLARLMYGGRTSLIVSFLAVFIITGIGIVAGGIAGYFGGVIDNVIMRICDILMCLPGIPILLIVGIFLREMISDGMYASILNADTKIYFMMAFIALISWPGTARLVRGQILSLREQEYMVAAEAMGYSTFRKIFKHLIPNVMPQLIVQMTLSLGGMIIYESSLSYLGFGVQEPNTAWGSILKILEGNNFELAIGNPLIWVPAGICIVIAVLGFNFVGDGLRDALDPKGRR